MKLLKNRILTIIFDSGGRKLRGLMRSFMLGAESFLTLFILRYSRECNVLKLHLFHTGERVGGTCSARSVRKSQRASLPPCHLRTETDPVSETLSCLEYRKMDRVQKLSVTRLGQNALEMTFMIYSFHEILLEWDDRGIARTAVASVRRELV
jgi:hypothetical protein